MDQLIKDRYNNTILQEAMRRYGITNDQIHSLDGEPPHTPPPIPIPPPPPPPPPPPLPPFPLIPKSYQSNQPRGQTGHDLFEFVERYLPESESIAKKKYKDICSHVNTLAKDRESYGLTHQDARWYLDKEKCIIDYNLGADYTPKRFDSVNRGHYLPPDFV